MLVEINLQKYKSFNVFVSPNLNILCSNKLWIYVVNYQCLDRNIHKAIMYLGPWVFASYNALNKLSQSEFSVCVALIMVKFRMKLFYENLL
jgi:hypothetical protein